MIDVVMPCWIINEDLMSLTELAVESLKPHRRLIIIDNGSTMGGGKLRELADVYVRNKTNLGYAKAVNQGLSLAGDIVAVANNDIRVSPNWYEVAEEVFKDIRIGSLHFRMIPYEQPFNPGTETKKTGREKWCSGSFFVLRKNWFFDEDFLNSYDDWDLQTRIRKDGCYTTYTNKAEYQHMDSSTQVFIDKRTENDQKNKELFKQKHGEYPEDMYWRLFPKQMETNWKPMP